NNTMALILILTGIYLTLIGIFNLKKFQLFGLLTAFVFTVLSIELLSDLDGLTLGVLTALCLLSLPSLGIKIYDIIGFVIIALPCIFWLTTQEFVDGSAYSHIFVALGVALASNLLFDKRKRQTLCALVLLTSFVICSLSDVYFSVIDIATSFLIAIVFSEKFEYKFDFAYISAQGTKSHGRVRRLM
ncbi:MAG: hypothetical protein K2I23_02380, partial [Clostridia bacterium]|nr:hypothetical protein [Clostridia bacterium]